MNIHEYQAKAILKVYGAPVAEGVVISSHHEVKAALASLPGPQYVIKSQIHAGGRGKGRFKELHAGAAGGVRVASSVALASAHISEMLGNTLITKQTGPNGKRVNQLYIEDAAEIARELYCCLLIDRATSRATFVVSTEGGVDIESVAESTPERIISVPVDPQVGVTDENLRAINAALDLTHVAAQDGERLYPILYAAFVEKDMSLLEINPLIVKADGRLRVLDAKISLDANAGYRHRDLDGLRDATEEDPREVEASQHGLSYVALEGNIGCMVNGAGLSMATMDIIQIYGAKPANFLDVGGGASKEKVAAAFKIITSDPSVRGILVNIFGGIMRCDVIAQGVVDAVEEVGLKVPLVVRLEGTRSREGKELLNKSGLNVISADDLDDAARKIVAAVQVSS